MGWRVFSCLNMRCERINRVGSGFGNALSAPDWILSGTENTHPLSGDADQLAIDELLNTQEGQFAAKA